MADPQILRLTGVEVQIELWRGGTYTFDAFLTYANGTPVPLSGKRVTLKVTDRAGGVEQYVQVNVTHVNDAGGQTRFSIPASATASLAGGRSYTWKYLIFLEDPTTGSRWPFFYGDLRILVPNAAMAVLPLGVSVGDAVGLADST